MAAKKRSNKRVATKKFAKPRRKRLLTLVIDRAKWGKEELLARNGKMCCLGFAAIKLGLKPATIRGEPMPSHLATGMQSVFPAWMVAESDSDDNGPLNDLSMAIHLNDSPINGSDKPRVSSEADRERKLKRLFAKHGCKLTFVGKREPDDK